MQDRALYVLLTWFYGPVEGVVSLSLDFDESQHSAFPQNHVGGHLIVVFFRKCNRIGIAFNSLYLVKFLYVNYEVKGGELYIHAWRDTKLVIRGDELPIGFLVSSRLRAV